MIYTKLLSRFQRGNAARDIATLSLGTVIAQSIAIAVTPLLTRLYSPSDFGLLAIFLAVVSVGATLVTLRYETSILVPKENTEAANLVLLSLILGGGLSMILVVLGVLLPIGLQEKIGLGALGNWVPIAFLMAAATAALAIIQGWMNRQKKYKQMAWLRVSQSISVAGLAIFLGVLHIQNGLLIAQVCSSAFLCLAALWLGRSAAHLWETSQLQVTAFSHKNTPKYLLPTALLDVITLQMPVVLIAMWFGADEAGQFSMAWRMLMLPTALVGAAIGQVFMQRFSSAIEDPILARRVIKQSWILLFSLGFIPFALIFMEGDFVFEMILGGEWSDAGSIAMILAPMALAMFVSSPTSGAFVILGLQKYSLFFGVTVFVYRPLCIYIGVQAGDLSAGIKLWIVLELFQIFIYQLIVWKKIGSK
ncbi:oligosaccharide flippase family protein [Pseudomonas chengduensis]|nr:oligosaccharide flippase family protein [Pseudomonas chengduensis]MDH0957201.1 oligosaccharide flippase family protein [Pseudomonas chengduensis]